MVNTKNVAIILQILLYLRNIIYLWLMINQERLRAKAKKEITTQDDIVISINGLGYKMDRARFSRWLSGLDVSNKDAIKIKEGLKQLKR